MSLTTWFLRRTFRKNDDRRDAGLTTPEDIVRRDDVAYGPLPRWQVLDVYRPRGLEGKLPVIVSVRGGGWTYGDKERYQYYCMDLARRGFAVVNFTYRLAPEYKFPAGIEDTCLVFSWLRDHAEGLDLDRVFAVGDSAGAHMLTIYSVLCTNPDYARKLGLQPPALRGEAFVPAALALNCGVYGFRPDRDTSGLTRALMKALLLRKGSPEELELVNPVPYINQRFPRAFVMTANHDALAGPPAQKGLTGRLAECGVPFVDRTYGTQAEPLEHVFHCDVRSPWAAKCNDDEAAFFLEGAQGHPCRGPKERKI